MRGHSAACPATGQQHGFMLDYNNRELSFCSLCWQVSGCSPRLYYCPGYVVSWVFYSLLSKRFLSLSRTGYPQGERSHPSFQGRYQESTNQHKLISQCPALPFSPCLQFNTLHPHQEMPSAACLIRVRKVKEGERIRGNGVWRKMARAIRV